MDRLEGVSGSGVLGIIGGGGILGVGLGVKLLEAAEEGFGGSSKSASKMKSSNSEPLVLGGGLGGFEYGVFVGFGIVEVE